MSLVQDQYRLNETLHGSVTIANQGWAKSVELILLVEGGDGFIPVDLGSGTSALATDETRIKEFTWPVAASPAGSYRVRAELRKDGKLLAESSAPFTILPTLALVADVTCDRPEYGGNEPVLLQAMVTSRGNYPLGVMTVQLSITDAGSATIHQSEQTIAALLPGVTTSVPLAWNTAQQRAGLYRVDLTVLIDQELVASASTSLVIRPELELRGTLSTPNPQVRQGEDLLLDWSVTNLGNYLAELPLQLILYSGAAEPLVTVPVELTLDLGTKTNGRATLTAETLDLGTYRAALLYQAATGDVELATCQIEIIDATPPQLQLLAPHTGSTYNGPVELAVSASDGESGLALVEYRIDDGDWLPLPALDQAGGIYGLTWEPVQADEGAHRLEFRARDRAGNLSPVVPSEIVIELCQPFAELSGTIDYAPQPLYLGQQITFPYTLHNFCPKELLGLNTELQIIDPRTDLPLLSVATTVNLGPASEETGEFAIDSMALGEGNYQARLLAKSADEPGSRSLGMVDFLVQAPLELSLSRIDQTNLLVWLNYPADAICRTPEPGRWGDDERGHDHDSDAYHSGKGPAADHFLAANRSCSPAPDDNPPGDQLPNGKDNCVDLELLAGLLDTTANSYRLLESREEFEQELRNPSYSDFLILGDQYPMTDHLEEELRERVNSGSALLTAGWLPAEAPASEAWLGVEYLGQLPITPDLVMIEAGPLGPEQILPVQGRSWRVLGVDSARTLGWFTSGEQRWSHPDDDEEDRHHRSLQQHDDHDHDRPGKPADTPEPALLLHDYGLGRTLYLAFDFARTLTPSTREQLAELLQGALAHLHSPRPFSGLVPDDPAAMQLSVTSPGRGFELQLTATCPENLVLYDPARESWDGPGICLESELSLAAGATGYLPFYLMPSESAADYYLELEAGTLVNGTHRLLQSARFTLPGGSDRAEILAAASTALSELAVGRRERRQVENIRRYLARVESRRIDCERDLDKNIADLGQAIAQLLSISCCEVQPVRLLFDQLLRGEEARWYHYQGPTCSDREGKRHDH